MTLTLSRWGTDYLLKCHVSEYELYGQVGNSELDHGEWTRPEDSKVRRPAYKITKDKPGSDLAAETAAAFASAAFLLQRYECNGNWKLIFLFDHL